MRVLGYDAVVEPLAAHLGGGYVGYIAALKGCVADGDTIPEAIDNLEDAARGWLETAAQAGMAVPAASPLRIYA